MEAGEDEGNQSSGGNGDTEKDDDKSCISLQYSSPSTPPRPFLSSRPFSYLLRRLVCPNLALAPNPEATTHLHQIHTRHDRLDLLDDLCLCGRIDLF